MDEPAAPGEVRRETLAHLRVGEQDRRAVESPGVVRELVGVDVFRLDQQVVRVVAEPQRVVEDRHAEAERLAARAAQVTRGQEVERAAEVRAHSSS